GDQYQRPVRQLGQMGIAEWQLHTSEPLAIDEFQQLSWLRFTGEDMQLQLTPHRRRRGQREGRPFAVLPLQQRILASMVAWWFAGRCTQAQTVYIATDRLACDELTAKLAHGQFAGHQYALPMQ